MSFIAFCSDIHLTHNNPKALECFKSFLTHLEESPCEALFILGDFFSLWLGDSSDLSYLEITAPLRKLASKTPVYLMVGNRDFLLSSKEITALGCKPISDPTHIELKGHHLILTHGDKLCTRDRSYQFYRHLAQNPLTKMLFLCLPLWVRRKIASRLQRKPQQQKPGLADKWQTTEEGLAKAFSAYPLATILVHGHTHTPRIHGGYYGSEEKTVINLGEWFPDSGSYLELHHEAYALRKYIC